MFFYILKKDFQFKVCKNGFILFDFVQICTQILYNNKKMCIFAPPI